MQVQDILDRKGNQVYLLGPEYTMREAAAKIAGWNVGAALVTDANRTLLGIISERDFLRTLVKFGGGMLDLRVSVLMTKSVVTCEPETTVSDALALMSRHHFRHLPVVRDGHILGLLSIRDLLECRLEALEEFDREQANGHAPVVA
ncbi:MAG TPA: CBS domain-containing protein [Stellaceae bacterium]|nr:CBS domain-containing protein [Stellaceae bacterium]